MSYSFLLKSGDNYQHLHSENKSMLQIPKRARPQRLPRVGDTVYLWDNTVGLWAQASVEKDAKNWLVLKGVTVCASKIPPEWLDDADRDETTIRSKIHCDRHDRLWSLSESEIDEIEASQQERS